MPVDQLSMPTLTDAASRGADALAGQLARVQNYYDSIPYESMPFPQTHPVRTGATAVMFGLTPPLPRTARVLELGCAAGGNLIPLAAQYPEGRFLGFDLSGVQVAQGRARVARAGLANIELRHQSLTEVGEAEGLFDYIICHGVYSWVPDAVRTAILRVCKERLAPDGIAYVSYNVLPGWRQKQALRDAMLLYTGGPGTPDGARRARDMLKFLETHAQATTHYGAMVRAEAARLAQVGDYYLTHEYLEDENSPCTFTEFASAAAAQGLAYLAEAEVSSMLPETVDANAAPSLREFSANQLIPTEQVLDLMTGRTFRQTLMVHGARAGFINRQLNAATICQQHFLAPRGLTLASQEGDNCVFADAFGRTLKTGSPAVRRALERMIARVPSTASLADIADKPSKKKAGASEADQAAILDALFKMHLVGMIGLSLEPVVAASLAERPTATALARVDGVASLQHTVNLRHESVVLDTVTQHILPKLDGTHDAAALEAHVVAQAKAGGIAFLRHGVHLQADDEIALCAKEHVQRSLSYLASAAMLRG